MPQPPSASAAPTAPSAPTASARSRVSAQERREQICRAALQVIARKGFAGTTLRDVAAEAGVAHGLLRHHFGDRDALLAAAFDLAAAEQLESYGALPEDPVDALRAYLAPLSREHYLQWIDAYSEAPRSPQLLATLARLQEAYERDLRRILERGIRQGRFHVPVGVTTAASVLLAAMDGLAVQDHALSLVTTRTATRRLHALAEALCDLPAGTL